MRVFIADSSGLIRDRLTELLAVFSLSQSNLQFYYIDKLEDDVPLARLKNGQKVWYAVVPYDRNYDPTTGALFSLPDPASGKAWNRPGDRLYTVVPRSEANEFRAAGIEGEVVFYPASGEPVYQTSAKLSGQDGDRLGSPRRRIQRSPAVPGAGGRYRRGSREQREAHHGQDA